MTGTIFFYSPVSGQIAIESDGKIYNGIVARSEFDIIRGWNHQEIPGQNADVTFDLIDNGYETRVENITKI